MNQGEGELIASRQFLSNIGLWPDATRLDLRGWLKNFAGTADSEIARSLLESFVHINERQVAYAALSGFHSLSSTRSFGPAGTRQTRWQEFLASAYVTFPSGSSTDDTASGHIFGRIMKVAGFEEARILGPANLVRTLAEKTMTAPAVFLDDIAGTGTQFVRCWNRRVSTARGKVSLSDLQAKGQLSQVFYVPIVATRKAITEITARCADVEVSPVYVLEEEYYGSSPSTRLVPDDSRTQLPPFATRYGAASGHDGDGAFGFGDIGLALSFHHSVPNNALPIFHQASEATKIDWKVLIS